MRLASYLAALGLILCTTGLAAGDRLHTKTHTVTIEDMRFQPDELTVSRGDTIVWVNKDLVAHTATSEVAGFDSNDIQPEKSWRYTASKKGEFAYVCTIHPAMKATLHVH